MVGADRGRPVVADAEESHNGACGECPPQQNGVREWRLQNLRSLGDLDCRSSRRYDQTLGAVAASDAMHIGHLHFLRIGVGLDRLWGFTSTVFGPGFLPTLAGRQVTCLLAIIVSPPFYAAVCGSRNDAKMAATALSV